MPASLVDPSPAPFQDIELESARQSDAAQCLESAKTERQARRPTATTDPADVIFVELEGNEHREAGRAAS